MTKNILTWNTCTSGTCQYHQIKKSPYIHGFLKVETRVSFIWVCFLNFENYTRPCISGPQTTSRKKGVGSPFCSHSQIECAERVFFHAYRSFTFWSASAAIFVDGALVMDAGTLQALPFLRCQWVLTNNLETNNLDTWPKSRREIRRSWLDNAAVDLRADQSKPQDFR